MSTTEPTRFVRINLSPRAGRLLGGFALVAMHGWFLLKLGLPYKPKLAIIEGCTEFCYANTNVWQAQVWHAGIFSFPNAPACPTLMFANTT